jgi:Fuc2NAc and GlcNAc transferase
VSSDLILLVSVLLGSAALTGIVRMYGVTHLVDIPNPRSSHSRPTPRGGGIAIGVAFLLATCWLWMTDRVESDIFLALAGGGLLVAAIGFWDDHGHVPARWRMLVHLLASVWSLYWLYGASAEPPSADSDALSAVWVLAGLFIVWMLNLFNFMDGIDGIAGVEALFAATSGALIVSIQPSGAPALDSAVLLLALALATAGFLFWNWPPAKIFMGDAGSGFLGFTLAVLVIHTAHENWTNLVAWLILLGVFLVDASLTLLRRMLSGQRWYEAHRSHAYQQAACRLGSHQTVTLAVAAINLGWLLPLAVCSLYWPRWAIGCLLTAYAPLILLALTFNAGQPPRA